MNKLVCHRKSRPSCHDESILLSVETVAPMLNAYLPRLVKDICLLGQRWRLLSLLYWFPIHQFPQGNTVGTRSYLRMQWGTLQERKLKIKKLWSSVVLLMTCLSFPPDSKNVIFTLKCKQIALWVKGKPSLCLSHLDINRSPPRKEKKKKKTLKYPEMSPYTKIGCKCFCSRIPAVQECKKSIEKCLATQGRLQKRIWGFLRFGSEFQSLLQNVEDSASI